jgi:hypothetical protein
VLGFALVGAHLAAAIWLIARAVGGSIGDWVLAAVVAVSWVLAWGSWRFIGLAGVGRLASLFAGTALIVPFTALLFVPLAIVWVLERTVWAVRLALWFVVHRPAGYPKPPAPDFGSTRDHGPAPLQRL